MNILAYVLSKSDEISRLKLFTSGCIKTKKHNLILTFIGQGKKPDIVGENFNWINFSDIFFSNRHIHALELAMEHEDIDYIIFCDNDVLIDVDYFIDNHGCKEKEPAIWTASPGMPSNKDINESITKHASEFLKGKNINDLYMGFCTSVINRGVIDQVRKNSKIIKSAKNISTELWKNAFVVDVQISIISFLCGAKHIMGASGKSSCWPAYMSSSLLNKNGKLWHIHGIGRSDLIDNENLAKAILNGPYKKNDLPSIIYKKLNKKFNVGKFLNNNFISNWGWAPWANASIPITNNVATKLYSQNRRKGKILIMNGIEFNWSAMSNGFTAYNENYTIDFFWSNDNGDIFGVFRNTIDDMIDGSLIVLNRI